MKYGDLTLGQTEALMNKVGGMDGLKKVLSGEWIVGEPAKIAKRAASASKKILADLLELVGEPLRVPVYERFVARDKFVIDRNGEVPISWLGDKFKANFLDLIEDNATAATLKQRKLLKSSVVGPILSALGGVEKATVALANAWEFLKAADRTKWFIFYIKDAKGTVWAVNALWRVGGWSVEAAPVADPLEWLGGSLVVSR